MDVIFQTTLEASGQPGKGLNASCSLLPNLFSPKQQQLLDMRNAQYAFVE
jgi:hypothetical protein